MAFRITAVTSQEKSQARSGSQYKQYAVMNPNDVVISAQVNQSGFDDILGEITIDNITGQTGDVLTGFLVLVSRTSSKNSAYLRTRVRKPISGSTLYINATSANIQDNDFIWVIRDVPLLPKYPYVVGETIRFDFDQSFEQIPPFVGAGTDEQDRIPQQAYVVQLSSGSASIDFVTNVVVPTSGAALSSVSLNDGNGNVTNPTITNNLDSTFSLSDSTLTYTSEGVYWLRLTMTDSNGVDGFYTCPVFVLAEDINESTLNLIEIESSRFSYELGRGGTCEIKTHYIPEQWAYQQLVCVFDINQDETENNVKFIGRIVPERNSVLVKERRGYVKTAGITLESTVQYITRVGLGTIAMIPPTGTPDKYGEVKDLTIWRAFSLIATQLCSLSNIAPIAIFDTSNDYRIDSFGTVKQSAYDTLESLQFAINAWMNERPEGGIHFDRSGQYLSDTDRADLLTIFDIEQQDLVAIDEIAKEHPQQIGRMVAYGGSYQTESDDVLVLLSYCPAKVPTEAPQRNEYNRQVLKADLDFKDSSSELSIRCQTHFAENNPFWRMRLRLVGSYDWLIPHGSQRYTVTIPSTTTVPQRTFTDSTYFYLQNSEINYSNKKSGPIKEITINLVEELDRGIYQTYEEQAPGLGSFDFGDLDPGDPGFSVDPADYLDLEGLGLPTPNTPLPPTGNNQEEDPDNPRPRDTSNPPISGAHSGSTIVSISRTNENLVITEDIAKPSYGLSHNINPTQGVPIDFCFDFYGTGIYALTYNSDTDNSLIYYKPTVRGLIWKNTIQLSGRWNRIKVGDAPGVVHIFMTTDYGFAGRENFFAGFDGADYENTSVPDVDDEVPGWVGGHNKTLYPGSIGVAAYGYVGENAVRAVQNFPPLQPGINLSYQTFVTFSFDEDKTVHGLSGASWLKCENFNNNSGQVRFRAILLDSSSSVLSTKNFGTYAEGNSNLKKWIEYDLEFSQVPNVRSVAFQVGFLSNTFGGGSGEARVDECYVYTEDTPSGKYAYSTEYGSNASIFNLSAGNNRPQDQIGTSVNYRDNIAYLSDDDSILQTNGGTPLAYTSPDAIAIWATNSTDEVWYSTETTLFKDGFNRTPNDGSTDGLAISEHSIAIPRTKEDTVYFLGLFGMDYKLARSDSSGLIWSVFTNVGSLTTNTPKGVFVNPSNWTQIIITTDGTDILYSEDGGLNFYTRYPRNSDISNLSFWENNWVI